MAEIRVDIHANFDAFERETAAAAAKAAESVRKTLEGATKRIPAAEIDADTKAALAAIRRLEKEAKDALKFNADIDTNAARQKVDGLRSAIEHLEESADIHLRVEAAKANASLNQVQRNLDLLDGTVEMRLNDKQLLAQTRSVAQAIRMGLSMDPDMDLTHFRARATELEAEIERLDSDPTITIEARANLLKARAEIKRFREYEQFNNVEVDVKADTSAARMQVAALSASISTMASRLGGGGTLAAIATLGPVIVAAAGPAIGAVTTLTASLGALGMAATAGFGVVLLALAPLVKGLTALQAQQKGAVSSGASAAQSAKQHAQAVADASDRVAKAVQSEARVREDAAKSTRDALASITEAQNNYAKTVSDSAKSVAEAQAKAAADEREAMQSVVDARETYARAVADADESIAAAKAAHAQAQKDADASVAEAERTYAERVQDANARVQEAKRRVAEVAASAADSIQAADARVVDAENALAQAHARSQEAVQSLTDARREGMRILEDYADRAEDGSLREQRASLSVERAQARLNEMIVKGDTSSLDYRDAVLSLEEAQAALEDVRESNQRLAEDKARADAAGVEGSAPVVAALRAQRDAADQVSKAEQALAAARREAYDARNRGIEDAQQAVTKAESDAQDAIESAARALNKSRSDAAASVARAAASESKARMDAAQRVADAQKAFSAAEDDATQRIAQVHARVAEERVSAQERIADAQKRVIDARAAADEVELRNARSIADARASTADARKSLGRAQGQSASTGDGAASAADYTSLSPQAQGFLRFINDRVMPTISRLANSAQAILLPAFQTALTTILPLLERVRPTVDAVARVIGDIAVRFATWAASPAAAQLASTIGASLVPALDAGARLIGSLGLTVLNAAAQMAGPGAVLLGIIAGLAQRMADWVASDAGQQAMKQFFEWAQSMLPIVATTFGALAGALVNVVTSLAPAGPVILGLVTAAAQFIASLPPEVVQVIAAAVVGVGAAFTALSPILSAAAGLFSIVSGVMAIAGSECIALVAPIAAVIAIAAALAAGFALLWANSETFRTVVTAAVNGARYAVTAALSGITAWVNETLAPWLASMNEKYFKPAFDKVIAGGGVFVRGLVSAVKAIWGFFQRDIKPVIEWLWSRIIKPVFDGIIRGGWWLVSTIVAILKNLKLLFDKTVKPVIEFLWTHIFKPVFDKVVRGVGALERPFRTIVSTIGTIWDTLVDKVGRPIVSVIDLVINRGLIDGINWLGGTLLGSGYTYIPRLPLPAYASGGLTGFVPGSNPRPGTDNMLAWISSGEFIIPQRATQALFAAIGSGGMEMLRRGMLPGYAEGGLVSRVTGAVTGALSNMNPAGWIRDRAMGALHSVVLPGGYVGALATGAAYYPMSLAENWVDSLLPHFADGGFVGSGGIGVLSSVPHFASGGLVAGGGLAAAAGPVELGPATLTAMRGMLDLSGARVVLDNRSLGQFVRQEARRVI